ncbi:Uncharacterised protein [Mycolicibacterium vanbaalenii]|uniref:Uncharacterized protein n=1 Tax=Mycolicibacterium vanbaalenii TaxID=110539 RepID=A0A5S9R6F7_MYCVN|nr:Uncharacterised protein [Mycolicibacterium vanbaalenii]
MRLNRTIHYANAEAAAAASFPESRCPDRRETSRARPRQGGFRPARPRIHRARCGWPDPGIWPQNHGSPARFGRVSRTRAADRGAARGSGRGAATPQRWRMVASPLRWSRRAQPNLADAQNAFSMRGALPVSDSGPRHAGVVPDGEGRRTTPPRDCRLRRDRLVRVRRRLTCWARYPRPRRSRHGWRVCVPGTRQSPANARLLPRRRAQVREGSLAEDCRPPHAAETRTRQPTFNSSR